MMDGFIIFTVLFQPIIIALLGLWMLKDKGADSAMFVVVGSGLTGLWSSLLFISGGSINAERWSGTLESLVAIPTPFEVIVYGKNLGNVIQSLISMVMGYFVATCLWIFARNSTAIVVYRIHFLSVIAFICFGLVIAPIFVIIGVRLAEQWSSLYTSYVDFSSRSRFFPAGRLPSLICSLLIGRLSLFTGPRRLVRH
jgi:ABC-2 type transport system permease protein